MLTPSEFGKAAAAKVLASMSDQGPPNTMLKKLKSDGGKGEDLKPAATGEGTSVEKAAKVRLSATEDDVDTVNAANTARLANDPKFQKRVSKVRTVYRGTRSRPTLPKTAADAMQAGRQ